jgi:hypothetical protein
MIQEDKELLLRDLCARLPYGVIVETPKGKGHVCDINLTIFGTEVGVNINATSRDRFNIEDIKPYLFPFSSMTEEEKKEYYNLCIEEEREEIEFGEWITRVYYHNTIESIDWLNKNHFDYRELIPMGLAIDATGLNIY